LKIKLKVARRLLLAGRRGLNKNNHPGQARRLLAGVLSKVHAYVVAGMWMHCCSFAHSCRGLK
jgi:hypothetical protein